VRLKVCQLSQRASIFCGVVAVNVVLDLVLIPRCGWWGAMATALICDTAFASLLAACIVKLQTKKILLLDPPARVE